MNKKSLGSIFLTVMIFSFNFGFSQDSKLISLQEALDETYTNNHSVKKSEAEVQEKEELAKARKSLYLPKIGLSANYVHMSHDLHLDMNPIKDAIIPLYETQSKYGVYSGIPTGIPAMPYLDQEQSTAMVRQSLADGLEQLENADWNQIIQEKQFAMLELNAQWVLYAGGKVRAANKASSLQVEEQKAMNENNKSTVFVELVQRYYGVNMSNHVLDIRKEVLKSMEMHLADAEKLENEGFIAKAELLHVKMSHAEAKREYLKAQRMKTFTSQALLQTISADTMMIVEPTDKLFMVDSIESLSYFKQLAHQNNAVLKQIDYKHEQSLQNQKFKRAEFLPTVAVMGMYDVVNENVSELMPEWMFGGTLSWTLFDGTARFNKLKSAKLKTLQVDEAKADVSARIEIAVEKYYNELLINAEQLEELKIAEEFAEEYVRVRKKGFEEEMVNSSDLVDAQLALAKVQVAKMKAMYQYDLALAHMLHYCGATDLFFKYMAQASEK